MALRTAESAAVARARIRTGEHVGPTSGLAPGAQETRGLGSALPFAFVVLGLSAAYALTLRFTRAPLWALAGIFAGIGLLLAWWALKKKS